MNRSLWIGVSILVVGFLGNVGFWGYQYHQNTRMDYCLEKPGEVFGGDLGVVPEGYRQFCQENTVVRQEVRDGQMQIEWFQVDGRNLTGLWDTLLERGARMKTRDPLQENVFLSLMTWKGQVLEYQAVFDGETTTITLSGSGAGH